MSTPGFLIMGAIQEKNWTDVETAERFGMSIERLAEIKRGKRAPDVSETTRIEAALRMTWVLVPTEKLDELRKIVVEPRVMPVLEECYVDDSDPCDDDRFTP